MSKQVYEEISRHPSIKEVENIVYVNVHSFNNSAYFAITGLSDDIGSSFRALTVEVQCQRTFTDLRSAEQHTPTIEKSDGES